MLAGCGGEGGGGDDEAAARLDSLGFFRYATPAAREHAVAEVREDPKVGVFTAEVRRLFIADAEDLAEGFADDFLRELAPVLREMGVPRVRIGREEFVIGGHYRLTVNGKRYLLYTAAEERSDHLWGFAAARTVAMINDLLRTAGSPERAYGYSGDNDFSVFLLTPDLREEIASIVGRGSRDEPYEVTDRPPGFGAPAGG